MAENRKIAKSQVGDFKKSLAPLCQKSLLCDHHSSIQKKLKMWPNWKYFLRFSHLYPIWWKTEKSKVGGFIKDLAPWCQKSSLCDHHSSIPHKLKMRPNCKYLTSFSHLHPIWRKIVKSQNCMLAISERIRPHYVKNHRYVIIIRPSHTIVK